MSLDLALAASRASRNDVNAPVAWQEWPAGAPGGDEEEPSDSRAAWDSICLPDHSPGYMRPARKSRVSLNSPQHRMPPRSPSQLATQPEGRGFAFGADTFEEESSSEPTAVAAGLREGASPHGRGITPPHSAFERRRRSVDGAAEALPKSGPKDFSQDRLRGVASFVEGYTYSDPILPGNAFFAALEMAVLDCAARGERPLRLRLPPTLVFGLPSLKPPAADAGADNPLWMWSDVNSGGGLRCMRRPIDSVYAAFVFLVGKEAAASLSEDMQHSDLTTEEMEHLDHTLATLAAVQKTRDTDKSQQLNLLTLRGLERLLREFSKTLMHHGSPENVFLEIPVTCVQRYIRPVGLTASCTRVRYTILPVLGEQVSMVRTKDQMEAFSIVSGSPMPKHIPEAAFQTDTINQLMTATLEADHAKVHSLTCRGEHWDEIRASLRGLTIALRRCLHMNFSEIVLEIIRLPKGGWWATQVKAFRAKGLPARPSLSMPEAPAKTSTLCMGDYCLSRRRQTSSQAETDAQGKAACDTGLESVHRSTLCELDSFGEVPAAGTGALDTLSECSSNAAEVSSQIREQSTLVAPASRRMPYRWLLLDRLFNGVVQHMHEADGSLKGNATEEQQLAALAEMVHEPKSAPTKRQPNQAASMVCPPNFKDHYSIRETSSSIARSQSLRRLYTPTCAPGHVQPLKCMAAARVYEEARVCEECYRIYVNKAAHWQKQPNSIYNVATVPALGRIGRRFDTLPSKSSVLMRPRRGALFPRPSMSDIPLIKR